MFEPTDATAKRLDELAVAVASTEWGSGVEVTVNGVTLRALRREAEQRRDPSMADWDDDDDEVDPRLGIDFTHELMPVDLVAPPSLHWLGEPSPLWTVDGRAGVLSCPCGDFGCGGLTTRIVIADGVVTWSEFDDRRPLGLGPFHFDRSAYEAALADLAPPPCT